MMLSTIICLSFHGKENTGGKTCFLLRFVQLSLGMFFIKSILLAALMLQKRMRPWEGL